MHKKYLAAAFALITALSPVAVFADKHEAYEADLEEATVALKEAAQRLAQLQAKRYAGTKENKRAMLGILLGPEHRDEGGVKLAGITPKSGASAAGLKAGDLIVTIGGIDLTSADHPHMTLSKHMRTVTPGEVVPVEYVRAGKRVSADITTQPKSEHILSMVASDMDLDLDFDWQGDLDSLRGLRTQNVTESMTVHSDRLLPVAGDLARYFDVDKGVIVLDPPEGSQLKAGDVLLAIADVPVASVMKAAEGLSGLEADAEVTVKRQGRERSVTVGPDEFANAIQKEIRVIRIVDDKP